MTNEARKGGGGAGVVGQRRQREGRLKRAVAACTTSAFVVVGDAMVEVVEE